MNQSSIISFFSSLLILSGLSAQPVLTATNCNPVIGDTYNWINLPNATQSSGNAGASVTWDFTALPTSFTGSENAIAPSSALYNTSLFTTSDVCLDRGGIYKYYQTSINGLLNTGGGSGSWYQTYSDPQQLLTYPFTYNSTFSDRFVFFLNNVGGGTTSTGSGQLTATSDAYGTLQMPYGNVNNVLRVKTVIVDTTVNSTSTNFAVYTNYEWYIEGKHQPVLAFYSSSINGAAPHETGKYLAASSMGINEIEAFTNNITIFPNPATEFTTINYSNPSSGNVTISVIDVLGQEVISKTMINISVGASSEILNIKSLKRGIYFLRIKTNEATASKRIIIQ
jgi:hypothetical protein